MSRRLEQLHALRRKGQTAAERRVGEAAAGGMTNREIAEAFFVSLRTVETHLTHAYQKLGIQARGQRAGALRGSN